MEPISPTLSAAYHLLRTEIYRHLDEAEYLAQFDTWDAMEQELARKVIPDLATVIRGMVAQHESTDDTGRCKVCGIPWPCSVTETVHALVTDQERTFRKILGYTEDS